MFFQNTKLAYWTVFHLHCTKHVCDITFDRQPCFPLTKVTFFFFFGSKGQQAGFFFCCKQDGNSINTAQGIQWEAEHTERNTDSNRYSLTAHQQIQRWRMEWTPYMILESRWSTTFKVTTWVRRTGSCSSPLLQISEIPSSSSFLFGSIFVNQWASNSFGWGWLATGLILSLNGKYTIRK